MVRLTDIVVMVTGAGSGIGRAVALYFAARGASVGVVDSRSEPAENTLEEVRRNGGHGLLEVSDVRNIEAISEAIGRIESQLGPLAIQVNCAGVNQTRPFLELTEQEWDYVMDTNARGLFFCVQAAGKVMLPRKRGAIVNISSVGGRRGRPIHSHYAASKAAVISITRSAALAFGPHGIRVNAICPGAIETPMLNQLVAERYKLGVKEAASSILEQIPLGRVGTPEEVASVAAFLASDEASYVNGQSLNVCGGMEMD